MEETKETMEGMEQEETVMPESTEAAAEAEAAVNEDILEEIIEEAAEETEAEAKGGFFSKKNKKSKKEKELEEQVEQLEDRCRRQMAEFENFRKRTDREKAAMYETGARSVLEKILPVVDNFERGLATIPAGEENNAFAEGMGKIYKQLMAELEAMDVKPIEAVGQPFDPNLHNAVMHIEDEQYGENVVAAEFQKGYTYRGTVVRHSMVQVAN